MAYDQRDYIVMVSNWRQLSESTTRNFEHKIICNFPSQYVTTREFEYITCICNSPVNLSQRTYTQAKHFRDQSFKAIYLEIYWEKSRLPDFSPV